MKTKYITLSMAAMLALGLVRAINPQSVELILPDNPVIADARMAPTAARPSLQEPAAVQVRHISADAVEDLNLQPLIKEDFSLMTNGSESEPHLYSYGYIMLPDEVTHTPGWSGAGIAEAGGKLALATPGYGGVQGGGCINTPLGDYSGHLIIKYRVKALSATGSVFCNVCKGGIEYPKSAIDGMNYLNLDGKSDWVEETVEVINPNADADGFIQLNAMTFNGDGFLIDKIEVYRDMDYLYAPNVLSASGFKTDSFTASWNKVSTASDYLVTLYEDTPLGTENFTAVQDFDGIKTDGDLDAADIPEGWDIHLTGPKQTTADHGYGDSEAVVLSDEADYVQLPYNGGTFLNFSVHLRNLESDMSARPSYVNIEVRDPGTGAWKNYATLNANTMSDTEGYTVSTKEIEAQYGKTYPFASMYDCVRVRIRHNCAGGMAVDHIVYETTPPAKRVTLKDNMPVTDNTVTFTGLDPEAEHYFMVSARNGEKVSAPSSVKHAFGISEITGFKIIDVDPRGGMTALWDRVPRADRYEVGAFEVTKAAADAKDYVVLGEDFAAVTVRNPVTDPLFIGNENALTPLDEYTSLPGWTGKGTILAKGMLGCIADQTATFEIFTPYITLSNNSGKYSVYLRVYAEKGTQFVVQGTDTYQVMEFPDTGTYEATIPMENGQDQDQLMFYTISGEMFLIDELRVMQDVKAGDPFYTRLEKVETSDCEHRFTIDPEEGKLYSAQVQAFQTLFKKTCKTSLTPMLSVDFFAGSVEGVGSDEALLRARGLDGALSLSSSAPVDVTVADLGGRLRFVGVVDGDKTISLAPGVYVVAAGNQAYKLTVR